MDLDFGLGHQEERETQQSMLNENGPFQAGCNRWKMMWNTNKSLYSAAPCILHPKLYVGELWRKSGNFYPKWLFKLIHFEVSSDPHFFPTGSRTPRSLAGAKPKFFCAPGSSNDEDGTTSVGAKVWNKNTRCMLFWLQIVPKLLTQAALPKSGIIYDLIVWRKWWENPMNWNHVKSLINSSINSIN